MALRETIVPNTELVQVAAEGSPRETTALTVSGTLDGTPSLQVKEVKTSDRVVEGVAASDV